MSLVQQVACDNPRCREIGIPEDIRDDGTYAPPYGWFASMDNNKIGLMGTGPYVHVDACSVGCLSAAFAAAIERHHYAELEAMSSTPKRRRAKKRAPATTAQPTEGDTDDQST